MSIFGATETSTGTRRRRPAPTPEQRIDLILSSRMGAFADDDERREVWEDHGKALLERRIERYPGRRPEAWWSYSAPEPRDHSVFEAEQLIRLGVVDEKERAAIEVQWSSAEARARDLAESINDYDEYCHWAEVPKKRRTLTEAELARLMAKAGE